MTLPAPYFVSTRGRVHSVGSVRRVVLGLLRKRWRGLLHPCWISRVDRAMTPEFLRLHNGEVPAALARDLELVAIGVREEAGRA